MINLMGSFATLGGFATLNIGVTETLINVFKVEKKWIKQVISWVFPVLLACIGFLCQLGLFAAFGPISAWTGWVYTILTGVGVGLVSNGLYEIQGVENALAFITKWIDTLNEKRQANKKQPEPSEGTNNVE